MAIILDFPRDPDRAASLKGRLKSLPGEQGIAVAFEIEKLEKIRVAQEKQVPVFEGVATFNRRFDVFVLEPYGAPRLIVTHDRQDDFYVLADICDHWPTADYAVAQSAIAVGQAVNEVHIWPRR